MCLSAKLTMPHCEKQRNIDDNLFQIDQGNQTNDAVS